MYHRCRNDKTGFEPRRLYNVVEFLMNDKNGNGLVSVEEAMQILFLRYGRQKMDEMLQEIFGTSDIHRQGMRGDGHMRWVCVKGSGAVEQCACPAGGGWDRNRCAMGCMRVHVCQATGITR